MTTDKQVNDDIYEISVKEYMVIWCYQIATAIERMEEDTDIPDWAIREIKRLNEYVQTWRPFKGYKEAVQHLKTVNAYHHEKYGEEYIWYNVLEWGDEFERRCREKYGTGKKGEFKRSKFHEFSRGE